MLATRFIIELLGEKKVSGGIFAEYTAECRFFCVEKGNAVSSCGKGQNVFPFVDKEFHDIRSRNACLTSGARKRGAHGSKLVRLSEAMQARSRMPSAGYALTLASVVNFHILHDEEEAIVKSLYSYFSMRAT